MLYLSLMRWPRPFITARCFCPIPRNGLAVTLLLHEHDRVSGSYTQHSGHESPRCFSMGLKYRRGSSLLMF
jgi:hypothetical protein